MGARAHRVTIVVQFLAAYGVGDYGESEVKELMEYVENAMAHDDEYPTIMDVVVEHLDVNGPPERPVDEMDECELDEYSSVVDEKHWYANKHLFRHYAQVTGALEEDVNV